MRPHHLLPLLLAPTLAQIIIDGIPSCAMPCLSKTLRENGCAVADIYCACNMKAAATLSGKACIAKDCSAEETIQSEQGVLKLCTNPKADMISISLSISSSLAAPTTSTSTSNTSKSTSTSTSSNATSTPSETPSESAPSNLETTTVESKSSPPTLAIGLGAALGALAILSAILAFFLLRRRKRKRNPSSAEPTTPISPEGAYNEKVFATEYRDIEKKAGSPGEPGYGELEANEIVEAPDNELRLPVEIGEGPPVPPKEGGVNRRRPVVVVRREEVVAAVPVVANVDESRGMAGDRWWEDLEVGHGHGRS